MLIPRDGLSLSALDLSRPNGDLPASRFYESHIKILDLEGRLGSNVLLARAETTQTVYAIEREGAGLYVVCKLGDWVDVEGLSQQATVVISRRLKASRPTAGITAGAAAILTTGLYHENKKKRLAIEDIQSVVSKRARSQSLVAVDKAVRPQKSVQLPTPADTDSTTPVPSEGVGSPSGHVLGPTVDTAHAKPASVHPQEEATPAHPTAEDIFQNIRRHYLEALYHSLVCLYPRVHLPSPCIDQPRGRSRTSQKGHYRELAPRSISTVTLPLT